jgi:heptosyltransferase-2
VQSATTLVIQPFPGIGDMIWYLPYLKAIARKEGPITLLTKSRSLAQNWLVSDPTFYEILYAERRLLSRVIPEIARRRFQKSWVLHWSVSYASVPFFARIPERIGFGYGFQKYFVTSKKILPTHYQRLHPITQLQALMKEFNYPLKAEDQIPVICSRAQEKVREGFSDLPRPWMILGIGGSVEEKRWPLSHFAELSRKILRVFEGTLFICGSMAENEDAISLQTLLGESERTRIVTHLSISEAFAFINQSDIYIGNDTSLLNIAAAFGKPTIGLFGPTPPLNYVPNIHAIVSSESPLKGKEAMLAILPDHVFSHLIENKFLPIGSS